MYSLTNALLKSTAWEEKQIRFILKCSVISVHLLNSSEVKGTKCKAHSQESMAKFHDHSYIKADWLNAKTLLQCVMYLIL